MKNKIFTLLAFLLITIGIQAQTAESKDEKNTFTLVDKEAKFPGGAEGWRRYLETNLNANLGNKYIKLKKKEKSAQQTVKLQFIVDKTGKVSNVEVVNKDEVHPKLAAESIRVLKEGPDWEPAEQNGKKVIYQAIQYITWQVAEE